MSLLPGARLGSYVVVDSFGAGGMGEVHRARDTKLDRDLQTPPTRNFDILPDGQFVMIGRAEDADRPEICVAHAC